MDVLHISEKNRTISRHSAAYLVFLSMSGRQVVREVKACFRNLLHWDSIACRLAEAGRFPVEGS